MSTAQPAPERCEPLSTEEEAFMRAFSRSFTVVPRLLDAALQREQQLSLSEYTVMMHLSESADRRLRMSDLASRSSLSLSGMTRIVDRLARFGWIQRERAPGDRRGWNAILTEDGLARLAAAWPTHLRSVRHHVMDHVERLDLPAVTAALERFVAADGRDAVQDGNLSDMES